MKFIFIIFLLLITNLNLFSQQFYIDEIDTQLVGPKNVDVLIEEQKAYYINNYSELLNKSTTYFSELEVEKGEILEKKKIRRKSKKRLKEISKKQILLNLEIDSLTKFIDLWKNENLDVYSELNSKKLHKYECFNILSDSHVYSQKEFWLFEIDSLNDSVFWNEIITTDKIKSEVVTKWEKRKADKNCLSADPNDCLVWCQVEEVIYTGCPQDFKANNSEDCLMRKVNVKNYFKTTRRLIPMSYKDDKAIQVLDIIEIACSN